MPLSPRQSQSSPPTDAKVWIGTIVQWNGFQASGLIALLAGPGAAHMSGKRAAIVMAESQNERYAVIAARRNEIFPGGVVIAYGDEESMRELIAAPSIIEIGSCSHEAAVAVIANNSAGDADSEKTQKK